MQVSADRNRLEKELTVTLTAIVENSRVTLKNELAITLKDTGTINETLKLIDDDCNDKLLKIPRVIKEMLNTAEKNAEKLVEQL